MAYRTSTLYTAYTVGRFPKLDTEKRFYKGEEQIHTVISCIPFTIFVLCYEMELNI